MRGALTNTRGQVRRRIRRGALRAVIACAALVALSIPTTLPGLQLDGNPNPPTPAQIKAAENQVKQQQAALGAQQGKLSASAAQLAQLQTQAEVLTERYDKVLIDEQRAAAAYQITEAKLKGAEKTEAATKQRLAALAAEEFESGGGFGPMSAMLGNSGGPQGYLNEVGLGTILAQSGTDTLAEAQADDVVAKVFRTQAHELLTAKQSDLRAATALKVAIQAAVARQQAVVQVQTDERDKLASSLASAKTQAAKLKAARAAALAAEAAAAAARAAAAAARAAAAKSAEGPIQAPAWAYGSGASSSQGNIAANWALTQLGKPYQWGAAGPDTYDCSGLTMQAWAQAGVQLLHYTGYQWEEGPHVSLADLQRGDLLFYATDNSDPATIHHVGIYIGDGMMVDAPFTGAFVRIDSIYQPGDPIGAVRPAS